MNDSKLASRLNNVNNPFTKKFNKSVDITASETITDTNNGTNKPGSGLTFKKKLPDPVAENHVDNPFVARKPLVLKPLHKATETIESDNIDSFEADTAPIIDSTDTNVTTNDSEPVVDTVDKSVENNDNTTESAIETDTENEDATAEPDESEVSTSETDNNKKTEDAPAPMKKKRIRRTKQQIEADNAAIAAKAAEVETIVDSTDTDADHEIESTETNTTDSDIETTATVDIENTTITGNSTISFNEASKAFDSFGDEDEWVQFYNDILKTNADIKITTDINTAALIGGVCQLSNLRDRIWQPMNYYKNELDSLSSKEPEGFLERAKRMTVNPSATNDALRKKSATYACMNYKLKNGNIINLYDYIDKVRERYNFLKSVMDNIEFKKGCLVLATSALKMENSLTA